MNKQIPITVINLKKDTGRKNKITQQLNDLNLEFSFFDAIYGAELNDKEFNAVYNPKHSIKKNARLLRKNDIGCALSHLGVYQQMLDDNIDKMIILEDDVILDKEFVNALDIIGYLPENLEIFLLGYSSKRRMPCNFNIKLKNNHTAFNIGVSPKQRGGLYAYVINKRGALRMLSYKDSIYQSIDSYTGDYRYMNVYNIYPRVAMQNHNIPSSIGYDDCVSDEPRWKQQKIIKIIRNYNNKRRAKRQKNEAVSVSCILHKIKFKIKNGFKDYYS